MLASDRIGPTMAQASQTQEPRLRFQSTGGYERVFPLGDGRFTIGSEINADLRLGVPGIPREACVLESDANSVRVISLVEGVVRVNDTTPKIGTALNAGERLEIGPVALVFENEAGC